MAPGHCQWLASSTENLDLNFWKGRSVMSNKKRGKRLILPSPTLVRQVSKLVCTSTFIDRSSIQHVEINRHLDPTSLLSIALAIKKWWHPNRTKKPFTAARRKNQSILQGVMCSMLKKFDWESAFILCSWYLIQLETNWMRNGKHINFRKEKDEQAGKATEEV